MNKIAIFLFNHTHISMNKRYYVLLIFLIILPISTLYPSTPNPSISHETRVAPSPKPLKGIKKWLAKRLIKKMDRQQEKKNAPGAMLSFVTGILTFLLGNAVSVIIAAFSGNPLIVIAPVAFLISLVSGIVALKKIQKFPEQYKGKGFAIAGLALLGATIFSWLLGAFG